MANQPTDSSLIHRELARKAQDVYRVKNPRNEDYKLVWDSYTEIIPANGTADLPTYKMEKYLKEMTDLILREQQDHAVKEENERRRSRGEKEMEKYHGGDQPILEGKFAFEKGVANPEVRMKVYQELFLGLIREYGTDIVQREQAEATPTTHEQIMGKLLASRTPISLHEPPIVTESTTGTPTTPLGQLNQFQLRRVAREKGLPTEKTDKKSELIQKISENGGKDDDDED